MPPSLTTDIALWFADGLSQGGHPMDPKEALRAARRFVKECSLDELQACADWVGGNAISPDIEEILLSRMNRVLEA